MNRKYYEANCPGCRVQYQWEKSGFFKFYPAKFYRILFYEENGEFFELLTRTFLGVRGNNGREYVFSDEFGYTIPLSGYSVNCFAQLVTAEDFAKKAREYMEDKSDILPHLNKTFDKWRDNNKKRIEQENQERCAKDAQKKQDTENVNWLNDLLNNR